ncbi:MAG TPA: outer membrane lipoprotein carrier protein LolA [Polyangiaceae bacterium]|jgi:hypothetical protein|nr:outer membrane lipoprotein carrier protein LolA [Polyangiaceae bacterium]
MKCSRRLVLAGSAGVLATTLARASRADPTGDPTGDPTRNLLRRIAEARAPVRTLQGPFTQTRVIGLLAADVHSHGTMALVRPDRLRWQLDPPDDVTFFVGPSGLSYRSAHGSGSVPEASAKVAAALEDMRTLLGGNLEHLTERWGLKALRDDGAGAEIEAIPKDAGTALRSMRFALAPDLVRPTRAVLVESAHDRTTIEFGELAINAPVTNMR